MGASIRNDAPSASTSTPALATYLTAALPEAGVTVVRETCTAEAPPTPMHAAARSAAPVLSLFDVLGERRQHLSKTN